MKLQKGLLWILAAGAILTALGGCIFFSAIIASDWDVNMLSDTVAEEMHYTEPTDTPVRAVTLDFANSAIDIHFDNTCDTLSVEYHQLFDRKGNPKTEVTVTEENGSVSITERILWYRSLISLGHFTEPTVTLTLPAERDYVLVINTDNGAITVNGTATAAESITLTTNNGRIDTEAAGLTCAKELSCTTDNGRITVGAFRVGTLSAESDNGMITVGNGTANETVNLNTSNGKILITGAIEAQEIDAETDNGDLQSSGVLTADRFSASTDNGDIFITGILSAQEITLETDNGDIKAKVGGKRGDYTVTVEYDLGDTNLLSQSGGSKILYVETNLGDIDVTFAEE